MEINIDGFGTFTYCGSSKNVHRFETNGILIFERIAIRNLDGELTEESAKASLESYLNKFGKGLVRK
jgi:hypothetical protein